MVRANPVNGRKNLFLGTHVTRVIGMPEPDSRNLIDELMDFITRPQFVYRHGWRAGDLLIWDNRCVLHRGRPWDRTRYPRSIQRTTVAGTGPTVSA
jgi:alpha-ketoglutarate-dependent 2,4-dichlorophenoxyacetate dioxygenase